MTTMCKGEAQGLEAVWHMPNDSKCSNTSFAAARRSGGNLLYLEKTGGPLVTMWCWIPKGGVACCVGRSSGRKTAGNSVRSLVYWSPTSLIFEMASAGAAVREA